MLFFILNLFFLGESLLSGTAAKERLLIQRITENINRRGESFNAPALPILYRGLRLTIIPDANNDN